MGLSKMLALPLFFLFVSVCFFSVYASDREVMSVEANIFAPVISINVPDKIYFGNLTQGYDSEEIHFLINNTGTADIKITAEREDKTESVFKYLYLWGSGLSQKRVENFTINISKPSDYGGSETKTVYAKLKLSEFEEDVDVNLMGYKKNIIFWAMAR